MKHITLATILFAVACNALADEPYKHQYENGGYFDAQKEVVTATQENDPYKHEYENGGYFDVEALPPTAAGPALTSQPKTAP
jgi:hypothetical protein